ncbi:MAG: hypothetical protein ACJ72N_23185 [Labedaea sp.]
MPVGPGLFRRWLVATPLVLAGLVPPIVLADLLAVWQNWASRHSPVPDVVRELTPAIAIWTGMALVAGLIALLVARAAVTDWPKICLLTMTPTLVAFVLVGVISGLASGNRVQLLFLLDIPAAAGLGAGGYLLVRAGVRRLAEPAALDNLGTGLDVRLALPAGANLLLRRDRLVITEGGKRSTISYYDYRTVRTGREEESGVEVLAASRRRLIRVPAEQVRPLIAAITFRMRSVRADPMFQVRRDSYRRMGGGARLAAARSAADTLSGRIPRVRSGLSPMAFTVLLMATMPVASVILIIAATLTGGSQQRDMVFGAVFAVAVGLWAHIRFWRRRAARRYLETRQDR